MVEGQGNDQKIQISSSEKEKIKKKKREREKKKKKEGGKGKEGRENYCKKSVGLIETVHSRSFAPEGRGSFGGPKKWYLTLKHLRQPCQGSINKYRRVSS